MSWLKPRPTKREVGAARRLFSQRFRAGLSYAATPVRPLPRAGAQGKPFEHATGMLSGRGGAGPRSGGTALSFAFAEQGRHSFLQPLESLTLVWRRL
jgi:hypothetical protein